MTQKVVKLMLEKLGFQVFAAINGKDAQDLFFINPNQYSFVILDYEMPVQNGIVTARNIRNAGFNVKIIMLTAHSTEKDKQECLESGADQFMTKPVTLKDFQGILL